MIRTRNDIFAAINCRMIEMEENHHGPNYKDTVDCLITACAYMIQSIEGIIRRKCNET